MRLATLVSRRLFLSLSILPVVMVPCAVLADEPPESPPLRATMEAQEIRDALVIRVEGRLSEYFFEQYIFVKTHNVDLVALLTESEWQRRLESRLSEVTKYFTLPVEDWKQDHIGITIRFF